MRNDRRFNRRDDAPKLVPTGSVNRVLLIGGKKLTLFQSVGLIVIGLVFAGGVGTWLLMTKLEWSTSFFIMAIATALSLWGLVMIVNGVVGFTRTIRATKRSVHK
jgi:hypothetical protein